MIEGFRKVLEGKSPNAKPKTKRKKDFAKSHLEVRMFNVGKGEAILLVFSKKRAWLVDCGVSGSKRNKKLGKNVANYLKQRKLVLEALVATHPHFDHGGAFGALLQAKPKLARTVRFYRSEASTWHKTTGWIPKLEKELKKLGPRLKREVIENRHVRRRITTGVNVHLFASSGAGDYTSLFLQIRYHEARLLFTGDAMCKYETKLLKQFAADDFDADVIKVTHHGSSSGTAKKLLDVAKHGMTIASTADDSGHRLEKDTLKRLGSLGRPRRVFETLVDGDIVLQTDGKKIDTGILYKVDFEKPGRFAADLEADDLFKIGEVNDTRAEKKHEECE